jgi:hypothetical protein
MMTRDHPLIHLLLLIDMVWAEADTIARGRGMPKTYSEKTMFKVYLVSLVKKLWKRRGVWRYLKANPLVMETWDLIVLFNWLHDRPLGAAKSVLDCM